MSSRVRPPKPCHRCQQTSDHLYRVCTSQNPLWALLCKDCQVATKAMPGYRYGGTWKSNKRH